MEENREKSRRVITVEKERELREWQRQIEEREKAGVEIVEWCRSQGISKTTYYSRLRRVREYKSQMTEEMPEGREKMSEEKQEIIPIGEVVQKGRESRIEISSEKIQVRIEGGIMAETIKVILEALRAC